MLLESAIRGGYAVAVIDGFCDSEVNQYASYAERVDLCEAGGLDDLALADAIKHTTERYAKTLKTVVVGSGIDACNKSLEAIERSDLQWLGNGLEWYQPTARIDCELLSDRPLRVADSQAPYLYKSASGSGGVHIYRDDEQRESQGDYYRQSYMPLTAISHLFLANEHQIETIGFSTQWHSQHNMAHPFCFGGAINACYLNESCVTQAEVTARTFGLKGVNNIDYLYDGKQLYFLELNPRPSATITLYDMDYSSGLLHAHIEACQGKGLERGAAVSSKVKAFAIFYAAESVCISADFEWPSNAKDVPAENREGYYFEKNAPICTLYAEADNAATALTELQCNISELQKRIGAISHPMQTEHQPGLDYEIP